MLAQDRHRLAEATSLGKYTALSHVWCSVVGIVTTLRGWNRGIVARFPVRARDLSHLESV
jgi:hypothetical protein